MSNDTDNIDAGAILAITGTSGSDTLQGTAKSDILFGRDGNDTLVAGDGDDLISGGRGNDQIDGGAGADTAAYAGKRSNYVIDEVEGRVVVRDKTGQEGGDTLVNVERLLFSDTQVAFDMQGHAGLSAKVVGAVLGKQALQDKAVVGLSLGLFDAGLDCAGVAAVLIDVGLGKAVSDEALVTRVFANITGCAPSREELAYYVGLIKSGTHTQASLAALAAESTLNKVNIDLVGLAHTGIEYAGNH